MGILGQLQGVVRALEAQPGERESEGVVGGLEDGTRGGVGVVIVVSVVAFGIYYVCLIGGEALADKLLLSPFWAMWAANAIFGVIGAIMLLRSQKVGAMAATRDTSELIERARLWLARRTARAGVHIGRRTA